MAGFLQNLLRVGKRRRAAGESALPRTRELLAKFTLDGPVPCDACGYDLRGLPIASDARCPECGKPAFSSWIDCLATRTGCPADAFCFLIDALCWRRRGGCPRPPAGPGAAGFCRVVCAYALEQARTADAARELLADWHLRRAEQIGALVYALIAFGLFKPDANDSPDDFDGLPGVREMIELAG